jgi:hypothetical protein
MIENVPASAAWPDGFAQDAAIFLHLQGRIPTDRTHPRSPERPPWEREMLRDCYERLNEVLGE